MMVVVIAQSELRVITNKNSQTDRVSLRLRLFSSTLSHCRGAGWPQVRRRRWTEESSVGERAAVCLAVICSVGAAAAAAAAAAVDFGCLPSLSLPLCQSSKYGCCCCRSH